MAGKEDLTVSRVINASSAKVWQAWKVPALFEKWFVPAPAAVTSIKHEFWRGGAFATTIHLPDGTDIDAGEGCFLEVVEPRLIVFTDALRGGWRPNEEAFFSAVIEIEDHPDGCVYTATAMHKNDGDRQKHVEMGFVTGWAKAVDQLNSLAESM